MRRPIVLALAVLAGGCHEKPEEAVATEETVAVKVEAARVGDLSAVVVATGTVQPAPGAALVVTAPTAARIAEKPKAEGDRVRRGDLLVRFDAPGLRADAAARGSDLAQARAGLDNARRNHERLTGLLGRCAPVVERPDAPIGASSTWWCRRRCTPIPTDAIALPTP
jgi:multidrug efflux pump subunit AcrA (membrane-fusion protein)